MLFMLKQIEANVFASASAATLGLFGNTNVDTVEKAFANASAAAQFIASVDVALQEVTTRKATIGAVQNRLNSAADSLVTTVENATSAKSTLVQANQLPALALNLIG